jgi:hypothetical protein
MTLPQRNPTAPVIPGPITVPTMRSPHRSPAAPIIPGQIAGPTLRSPQVSPKLTQKQGIECDAVTDARQYGSFMTINNKYILGDKIFEKNKNKVRFMLDTNQITENGYNTIMTVINLWEEMYHKLINDVTTKREFTEKAGQGGRPRKLTTDKDWGEVIIELIDTINKYNRDVDASISFNTDPNTLKTECSKTPVDNCSPPCVVQKGWLRGYGGNDRCDYLP